MGFFKDVRKLQQIGREELHQFDAAGTAAAGLERMKQANAMMAGLTHEMMASTVAVTGVEGLATITEVRSTGMTVNDNPVLDLDLVLLVPGHPPLPTTKREAVMLHLVSRAHAGTQVRVKVDLAQPSNVFIDWVSSIRA